MKNKVYLAISALIIIVGIGAFIALMPVEAKPNRIGGVLFLTGNQAFLGQEVKNGMELAKMELEGKNNPVEVFYEDSRDTPRDALTAFTRLLSLKDVPIVVSTGDVVSLSLIPVAEREKVVLFATVASTSGLPDNNPFTFRYSTTTDSNAEVMVAHLDKKMGLKKVAALYINNDFGVAWMKKAKSLLEEKGIELVGEQSYAIDAQNLRAQIATLLDKKPEVMMISGFGPAYAVGIVQTRELSSQLPIIADATFSVPFFQKQAGSAGEGVYFASTIFDTSNPASVKISEFIKTYKNAYKADPGLTAALGYDTMMLIAEAFKKIKINAEDSRAEKADAIRKGLLTVTSHEGLLGPLSVESTGNVTFPLFMKKMVNGNGISIEE